MPGLSASEKPRRRALPTGSEEHEVLQTGSIHVAIIPSSQSFTIVHFSVLIVLFFCVVKIRSISEAALNMHLQYAPWP